MKKKLKIGWQKYEDLIEQQMSSPLIDLLVSKMKESMEEESGEEDYYKQEESQEDTQNNLSLFPISQQIIDDIAILSNFDCWMGHTNFDITPKVKSSLNSIDGIEVMRVCSRYRFFIGIGRMFDFTDVRKRVEDCLLN